ncbi:alkaline phosphatase D [Haloactinopolyspora alba]|uniref:Alkaline phosphatase D n=1 Tax=Haloactinopolyspora alba TaxID=648780 RepID=A0A2P8E7R8_9ACTN|nr:alkaline phosphatase D family protein [Haloactinopolyspora alba]PSL05468.1 alkaline phosphatase D [Haloactinopolyspora alba]
MAISLSRHARTLSRRHFLGTTGLSLVALSHGASRFRENDRPAFPDTPFSLGMASGEPAPDSVVLWTRLAPRPLEPAGGMPARKVPVRYEVATDEGFRNVITRNVAFAVPELAHSVHVTLEGLQPGRDYFYRFRAGNEISPVGRTRTAPAVDADPSKVTFAFASCQNYLDGLYTAYRHLAEEDLDFVVHLGDYIYEIATRDRLRAHVPDHEVQSLDDYRIRYGQYKSEPELQAAHAAFPWIMAIDDHDVENNFAAEIPQVEPGREVDVEAFLRRRAAAFQAFYENLPLGLESRPSNTGMRTYRSFTFGRLAELNVLDTRQYRANQVCGPADEEPTREVPCDDRLDPSRSMLGAEQEAWLFDSVEASDARWNVLANQILMFQRDAQLGDGELFGMDHWDGYVAARDRLLGGMTERDVENLVVLTGDAHINYAADLKEDFDDPASRTIGTEFAGTSISSGGDGTDRSALDEVVLAENDHLHFANSQRGYVRCTVRPEQWQADFRVVSQVTSPGAPISTRAGYVVENGNPGILPA